MVGLQGWWRVYGMWVSRGGRDLVGGGGLQGVGLLFDGGI